MRVLVTVATGLLGRYLMATTPRSSNVVWISHTNGVPDPDLLQEKIDLAVPGSVSYIAEKYRPDVIINAAAEGSVDAVERSPDAYTALNVDLVSQLVEVAEQRGMRIVHISSNAVFAPAGDPLTEDSELRPINKYGALKVTAEQRLSQSKAVATIVRPILMFGWPFQFGRANVVSHWISELLLERPIKAAIDVTTQPLYAEDCAKAVWQISQITEPGTYNLAGPQPMTLFSMAQVVARCLGSASNLVLPVRLEEFPELAPRPLDVRFDISHARKRLRFAPKSFAAALQDMTMNWGQAREPSDR